MAARKTSARSAAADGGAESARFTDEERAAIRQRSQELRASGRRGADKLDGEAAVRAKIAEMQKPDRLMAERIHAVITATAPTLAPTTWYGMPAYAQDGKMVCFFQPAQKFKTRYATLGFSDNANLDDGGMWPNAYAVNEITPEVEDEIAALIKKAVS